MNNPDEIREIKEKLAKLKQREEDAVEITIRPKQIREYLAKNVIVRFNNLSAWLKTIVLFGWVIGVFFGIYFVTTFIVGFY